VVILVEIKELIKLCDNDPQLLGAIQELKQYRENPLANMQPCWKYVRKNNIDQQLDHIMQEVIEAIGELNFTDKKLECFDILQEAITGMMILQVKYGVNLTELIQKGIQKNTNREGGSYYE